ncbi:MAG: hypothetical protein AVDCRST_MAG53-364, partial [uncultured Solirubrobacteraceae bacterium]
DDEAVARRERHRRPPHGRSRGRVRREGHRAAEPHPGGLHRQLDGRSPLLRHRPRRRRTHRATQARPPGRVRIAGCTALQDRGAAVERVSAQARDRIL